MRRAGTATAATVAAMLAAVLVAAVVTAAPAGATGIWPARGQAAYVIGTGPIHAGPHARARPIASVAKVMTAYLVLQRAPLSGAANGFTLTVSARDVADWHRRAARDESVVPVRQGERLTERQALYALLLPSANNVAIMLARHVSGRVALFVAAMNRAARALGMHRTTYTDPSGFDVRTVSVPSDQLRLAAAVMRDPFFRSAVDRSSARIPVAGTIRSTNRLLHHAGVIGIKTGSTQAAGGCLLVTARRRVAGHAVLVTAMVMGQPGADLIGAATAAARRLLARVSAPG